MICGILGKEVTVMDATFYDSSNRTLVLPTFVQLHGTSANATDIQRYVSCPRSS